MQFSVLGTREKHLMFVIATIKTRCVSRKGKEFHDSILDLGLSPHHIHPETIREPLNLEGTKISSQS